MRHCLSINPSKLHEKNTFYKLHFSNTFIGAIVQVQDFLSKVFVSEMIKSFFIKFTFSKLSWGPLAENCWPVYFEEGAIFFWTKLQCTLSYKLFRDTIFLLLVSFSNIWHRCQSLIFKITKMLFIVSIKLYLFLLSQKYLCQTSDFFIQNRNFISFNVFIASDLLLKDRNKFSKKSQFSPSPKSCVKVSSFLSMLLTELTIRMGRKCFIVSKLLYYGQMFRIEFWVIAVKGVRQYCLLLL